MTEFIVLGAGTVGVCTALELQARGHGVTLVDRRKAGCETSFGNAGLIQTEAAEPYALPRDWFSLMSFALGLKNDVSYEWGALLRMAPALWEYFRASAPGRHRAISRLYSRLTASASDEHRPLVEASGTEHLIDPSGYYQVYRDPRTLEEAVRRAERFREEYGVSSSVLDGAALADKEPAIKRRPVGAVYWDRSWGCRDPGALTAAYAQLFVDRGGRFLHGDAGTLSEGRTGWSLTTESGPVSAAELVVALGPWAPRLLRRFGYRIRMVYKRGYHGHFDAPRPLNRPLMDVKNAVVLSPMRQGLRMATGAALVDLDAPSRPTQLARAVEGTADLIDLGARIPEPQWYGTRPCLPDMLPMVGPAPRHRGLWFNFGHGHQGLTMGPITARLLADVIEGRRTELLASLAPARDRRL